MDDPLSPDLIPQLATRVRHERLNRGWDLSELARRAEISRTTLYHLEKGHTRRIRSSTVKTLADAFETSVEFLTGEASDSRIRPSRIDGGFDRATNPSVAEVVNERPAVFEGWSRDDWDELYSEFGVGGPLTPLGVLSKAEAINEKRETVRQLHVVLDTHLRDVAREVIETFYKMVQAKSAPRTDVAEPPQV
jgi:transcriptional regulator with XRE-family HTH domain